MIKKGLKSHFLVCLGITEDFLLLEHIFYIRKTFFLRYFGYMRSLFTRFFTWLFLFLCLCLSLWLCCSSAPQSPSPPSWGGPTAWRRWEWGGGSTLIMMLELIVFSVSSLPHTNWLCVAKKD